MTIGAGIIVPGISPLAAEQEAGENAADEDGGAAHLAGFPDDGPMISFRRVGITRRMVGIT